MRTGSKLLALIAAPVLAAAACSGQSSGDRLESSVHTFADALAKGDVAAAAGATSDPARATPVLTTLFDNLGTKVQIEVRDIQRSKDDASFTLDTTWAFGSGGNQWKYTTTGHAGESGDDWKIRWDPATVAPGLDIGPLSYETAAPQPGARVLDRSGAELMTQQVVTLVQMGPEADPEAVAAVLAPIDPTITAASLRDQQAQAQGKQITAIALRDSDFEPVRDQLSALAGVTLAPQNRVLGVDKAFTSPTMSGLTELWQHDTDAASGWAVRAQGADGARTVGGADPKPVHDIASTLDADMLRRAESALAPIPTPAAMVVLQPSTGDVLAVAQNDPADTEGPIALTGLYPPGSTFKTVTVSAALQSGAVDADSMVACPGTENIEGRQIPNDDNFDLGTVPLHTAFARSCNTTMGRLAAGLPPDGLTRTAAQLGLGVDFTAPGMTTVTGKVPVADSPTLRVEEGIGQGRVTASPFGMALVAATVAHGSMPAPTIVAGSSARPDRTPEPLPAPVLDQVKSMMRETVTNGTATNLADIPGMLGKTGTAEYIDDKHAHGWFVGINGDLALAVFAADAGSSTPAVDAAGRFLREQ